jgi:hypothetical protein
VKSCVVDVSLDESTGCAGALRFQSAPGTGFGIGSVDDAVLVVQHLFAVQLLVCRTAERVGVLVINE